LTEDLLCDASPSAAHIRSCSSYLRKRAQGRNPRRQYVSSNPWSPGSRRDTRSAT
jgi:hypothetical protein